MDNNEKVFQAHIQTFEEIKTQSEKKLQDYKNLKIYKEVEQNYIKVSKRYNFLKQKQG